MWWSLPRATRHGVWSGRGRRRSRGRWDCGRRAGIVQLHRGAVAGSGRTIYPGDSRQWHRLEAVEGIEALRTLADRVQGSDDGIVLVGDVGVTSHLGDILRRARIPSRVEGE